LVLECRRSDGVFALRVGACTTSLPAVATPKQ
jgi:hypothetical protein